MTEENLKNHISSFIKSYAEKKKSKNFIKKNKSHAKVKLPEEEIDMLQCFKDTNFQSFLIDANYGDNQLIFN